MKHKKRLLTIPAILISAMIMLISSCDKEEPEPPQPVATSIQLVSGGSQTADAGSALTNPVELIVKDKDGTAFAGTKITFTVSEGAVSAASGTTDKNGKVTVNWTLGTTAGAQTLIATAFKADGTTPLTGSPLSITATASEVIQEATSLSVVSGNGQTALIEATLGTPIMVLVLDQNDNPMFGSTVNFSVSEGSLSESSIVTGANGKASLTWTLGPTTGEQILTATAFKADGTTALSGSPLSITANAVAYAASRVGIISGNNQTTFVEETLRHPVKIMVQNQKGEGFPGTPVHFSLSEGSVSSETIVTDAYGYASAEWTLGSTVGTQLLTVTAFEADGTTPLTGSPIEVSATAEGAVEATSIELVSGEDQTGQTGHLLADEIVVIVKDQNGDALIIPVLDRPNLYFSVTAGNPPHGGFDYPNGGGLVEIDWVLGLTTGTQTLTITAFEEDGATHLLGSPITVNATALGVSTLELLSGNNQEEIIGGELTDPIEVLVKDEMGNPYRDATVSFNVTEGSVSSDSETTDASGMASITWRLGATVGTQTLSVTAFKEDGTTPLNGSPLSVTATGLAPPPQDPVTDYDGNVYQTVKIGEQIWMAENLKVTHYADGTAIPFVTDNAAWAALEDNGADKAYTYYGNNTASEYGALYTWAAAMNDAASTYANPSGVQGVCPSGWHLPSTTEWSTLWNHVGTKGGGQLKEAGTDHWDSPNTGADNITGFTALGGGVRSREGGFDQLKEFALFWTTREDNYNILAYTFRVNYSSAVINTNGYYKSGGLSVRCVKD